MKEEVKITEGQETKTTYEDLRKAPWEYLYENYLNNKDRKFYDSLPENWQEVYQNHIQAMIVADRVIATIRSLNDVLR